MSMMQHPLKIPNRLPYLSAIPPAKGREQKPPMDWIALKSLESAGLSHLRPRGTHPEKPSDGMTEVVLPVLYGLKTVHHTAVVSIRHRSDEHEELYRQ